MRRLSRQRGGRLGRLSLGMRTRGSHLVIFFVILGALAAGLLVLMTKRSRSREVSSVLAEAETPAPARGRFHRALAQGLQPRGERARGQRRESPLRRRRVYCGERRGRDRARARTLRDERGNHARHARENQDEYENVASPCTHV